MTESKKILSEQADPVAEASLIRLERQGYLRLAVATGLPSVLLEPMPSLPEGVSALDALLADRRSGR